MGAEVYRPDFGRGPKKKTYDSRRLYLRGVTELPVKSDKLTEPVQEAADAIVVFKLLREELVEVEKQDFKDLVGELSDAAADRYKALEALTPAVRDMAINQARQRIIEFHHPSGPPNAAA
jgi:hypothetical protein